MTNDNDYLFQDLASACQEIERLKADNRALEAELSRVFDSLGISNPPNAKPMSTHEHVARLKSENARLAAALMGLTEACDDCLPMSGERPIDVTYYASKLSQILGAAEQAKQVLRAACGEKL